MAKTVITPVGVSLFTNYMDKSEVVRNYPALSKEYEAIEVQCKRLEKLSHTERPNSRYESDINHIAERIRYLWLAEAKENASAEIRTLAKIAETEQSDLEVHLLATDTVLSVVVCELTQQWLEENPILAGHKMTCHFHYNTHVVKGLQVDDAKTFKTDGFQNLLVLIQKFTKPKETIINISGGYKALVPFVTLFAQLEAIPLKYMYEDSDALIAVGNLPFNFDFTVFTDEFLAFERIKPGKSLHNLPLKEAFENDLSDPRQYQKLEDALLIFEKDGKVHLSELGQTLYKKYEQADREDGFDTSNLLGKVMEVKVFEYFQKQFPNAQSVLGKNIGKSSENDAYDIDVFLENASWVWAIEVKPQNVAVLIDESMKESKKMDTLEYKCMQGAFKHANEQFAEKKRNIAVVMYHHLKPNPYQIEKFVKLKESYQYIRWIWLRPPSNYKGNVNWPVTSDKFKEFDFQSKQWVDLSL